MASLTVDVPDGVETSAIRAAVHMVATSAVARRRVSEVLAAVSGDVGPAVAWQLASAERLRTHLEHTYGVYTSAELAQMRSARPGNRSVATRWAERDGLLALRRGNAKVYPRFQFDRAEVATGWTRISATLRQAGWSDEDVLLWMVAPSSYLDGREPAAVVPHAPDDVLRVVTLVSQSTE